MNELRAPVESPILDEHGKPFIRQEPVRVDRDCPLGMTLWLMPRFNPGETYEDWARRCGVVTNVRMPE